MSQDVIDSGDLVSPPLEIGHDGAVRIRRRATLRIDRTKLGHHALGDLNRRGRPSSGNSRSDQAPATLGPRATPTTISPITGGWPILRNRAPTARASTITTATPSRATA